MPASLPKKYRCRTSLVTQHLKSMTLSEIATQARISEKTLRKVMRGQGVGFATVKKLARWLKLGTNDVLEDLRETLAVSSGAHFEFNIEVSLDAVVESKHQSEAVVHHLLACLTARGIKAKVLDARIVQDEYADSTWRVLVRLRGDWPRSEHFPYIYFAVRPSRYHEFVRAVQAERVDLKRYDRFGEIIHWGDLRPIDEMLRHPAPIPEYAVEPRRYVLERVSDPYFRSLISPDGRSLTTSPRPGKDVGQPRPAIGKGDTAGAPQYLELALPKDILYNLLFIDLIHGLDWLE